MSDKSFQEFFYAYNGCGVNGDDYVSWGEKEIEGRAWMKAVAATGGCPEPTKSPMDREYFTVNSQLWKVTKEGAKEIGTVRPSMLVTLHGGTHKTPHEAWASLVTSPVFQSGGGLGRLNSLELDVLLLPELGVVDGGLGMEWKAASTSPIDVLWRRIVYARESRGKPWLDLETVELPLKYKDLATATKSGFSQRKDDSVVVSTVSGWVDRKQYLRRISNRFGIGNVVSWLCPRRVSESYRTLKTAITILSRCTSVEKKIDIINQSKIRKKRENEGYVYVHDHKIYDDDDIELSIEPLDDPFVPEFFVEKRKYRLDRTSAMQRAVHEKKLEKIRGKDLLTKKEKTKVDERGAGVGDRQRLSKTPVSRFVRGSLQGRSKMNGVNGDIV